MLINKVYAQINSASLCRLYTSAEQYYAKNMRDYHSYGHAKYVVEKIFEIKAKPGPDLILAGVWHDAVYFPKAGSDANERCSAAALLNEAQSLICNELDIGVIDRTMELIQKTAVKYHMSKDKIEDEELAILLDADLSSLAEDYNTFEENQFNIIYENYGDTKNADHLKLSANFLMQLMNSREFIYHTEYGRNLFENKARENIIKYAENYLTNVFNKIGYVQNLVGIQ